MSLLKKEYLLFALRIMLGGLFIYAALPKIADPFDFSVQIYNYKLLPDFAIGLVAATLPLLELVAGLMLVTGVRYKTSAFTVAVLLVIFTVALFVNTLRGIDVECGCFSSDRLIGWRSVGEDALLAVAGIWYFLNADSFLCLQSFFENKKA